MTKPYGKSRIDATGVQIDVRWGIYQVSVYHVDQSLSFIVRTAILTRVLLVVLYLPQSFVARCLDG